MRKVFALASLCLALVPAAASAERTVHEISWSALKREGRLLGGDLVHEAPGSAPGSLRVTNPDGAPRAIPLFTLDAPAVKTPRYVLRGEVRGEGIEGLAYLEMWSFFAGGGRYFSRTLAEAGPMARLTGTFRARAFILPFTAEPGMTLEKLAVSVAFPGRGTVILGPLRLVELGPDDDFAAVVPGAWLTPREIGLAGGAAGTVLGLAGAAIGILASRARARGLVVGLLWTLLAVGVCAVAAAAAAWRLGQPPALVSLLALVGVLGTALPWGLLGRVKRQYEEIELRRIQALDAR
jgi:hypothetical protein